MSRTTPAPRPRRAALVIAIGVGLFAAANSYSHIFTLARAHGQDCLNAALLPLSVDGPIIVASLALLDGVRSGRSTALARLTLVAGIAATVAANALSGVSHGALAAVISAWPAGAFLSCAELAIGSALRSTSHRFPPAAQRVRVGASASESAGERACESAHAVSDRAPRDAGAGLDALFAPEISSGELPSIREIRRRARCGQPRGREIHAQLQELLAA